MCVDVIDKAEAEKPVSGASPLRVAVAGLGTIGEGAALCVIDEADKVLCAALVGDASKARSDRFAQTLVTEDIDALLDARPDIILDALPVGDAGQVLIEKALSRGISVVSANKQAVAGSIDKFEALARQNDATLSYSASVGGGAPMVETVREAAAEGDVVEMTAILNGTVNYILTALGDGGSFEEAVRQAQEAGFAEPDPTADLSGDDARAKISILCYEAFGAEIDLKSVPTQALDADLASEILKSGGQWRQLSKIRKHNSGAVIASVTIEKVSDDDFFAGVRDEGNALRVVTETGEDFSCVDKGAGRSPTVASLFSDLEKIRATLPPRTER